MKNLNQENKVSSWESNQLPATHTNAVPMHFVQMMAKFLQNL
jgi:hypothetical protein